jgi:hypothetical protein
VVAAAAHAAAHALTTVASRVFNTSQNASNYLGHHHHFTHHHDVVLNNSSNRSDQFNNVSLFYK